MGRLLQIGSLQNVDKKLGSNKDFFGFAICCFLAKLAQVKNIFQLGMLSS